MPKASSPNKTKIKIQKTALRLFNSEGVQNIHTHDIAKAAGISPGNLYYHYRNKEEIIHELLEEMKIYNQTFWSILVDPRSDVSFSSFMDLFFSDLKSHWFLFRDFSLLVATDGKFEMLWRERFNKLSNIMVHTVKYWVKSGKMKHFKSDIDLRHFLDSFWILLNFAPRFYEVRLGKKGDYFLESIANIQRFLIPYHTKKGLSDINKYFNQNFN
jgi:AcrR family transcriptional regulator